MSTEQMACESRSNGKMLQWKFWHELCKNLCA